ncbi:IclR family transcriptional regulator [Rubrobacter aplysinae]|uniref:IclR family transcriptional regulator n=1 Tax=Rubrobacter aplysinae TaxID=909625 RepID=UPI00064BBA1C|nr:IclR family transcriptional regulator [Rubrobacter aplysinae]
MRQQKQQVVWKVARMLDLFTPESPEWRVGEVAEALGVPKTTASELMTTLAEQRLLRRTEGGRYRLGWRLFELSQNLLDTTEFRTESHRVIEELVEGYGETVHLAVLDNMQAVYIEKQQPTPAVKILASRAGGRLHAHCSGVGKVLLSACEWDRVERALEHQGMPAFTQNTIVTPEAMAEELREVRARGHAFDLEETLQGLCCVAAPVRDAGGEVIAALSISAPAFRFETNEEEYTRAVLEAARRISQGVGNTMGRYQDHEDRKTHRMEGSRS